MKLSRSILLIVSLITAGVAILYFFAPLSLIGNDVNTVKVDDSLLPYWDDIGIKVLTYNLLRLKVVEITVFQESTWWSFGLLAITFVFMHPFIRSKSIGPYVFIGILAILIILFGSFLVGGLMIFLGIIAAFDYARFKRRKLNKKDYSDLYREYII